MKAILTVAFICSVFVPVQTAEARELAADYILPSVSYRKVLFRSTEHSLSRDPAGMQTSHIASDRIEYQAVYNPDVNTIYKIIHFTEGVFASEQHAFFLSFSGGIAYLKGYSKYRSKQEIFRSDILNETYSELSAEPMYKVPSETSQTETWTFTDPLSGNLCEASSYFIRGNLSAYGNHILVFEFKTGGKISKEYYLKNFGILAVQKPDANPEICDLKAFKLFNPLPEDAGLETLHRNDAWNLTDRFRMNAVSDSFFRMGSPEFRRLNESFDSLTGYFEHLMLSHPERNPLYRYMFCTALYSVASRLQKVAERTGALQQEYNEISDWYHHYYFLRPYPEAIAREGSSTYVSNISENYYSNFWTVDYGYLKLILSHKTFEATYKAYLMKPRVDVIIRSEEHIDAPDKCVLYSMLAVYYDLLDDHINAYRYRVLSLENFHALKPDLKAANREYVLSLNKKLSMKDPGNEDILIRAIKAMMVLNDFHSAASVADNGFKKGRGISKTFLLLYAEAAYRDAVNSGMLRTALDRILKTDPRNMTVAELRDVQKYCRALNAGNECIHFDRALSGAEKREKEELAKKQKAERKKSAASGRSVNVALLFNPFAGANIGGVGGMFKFIPLSAELRKNKIMHEIRYNPFLGSDFKNRLVGGKFIDERENLNEGWKNLRGADYSYGLFFVQNEMSTYKKTCRSTGAGLVLLYGQFRADPEKTNASVNGISSPVMVDPKVNRYEALFMMKLNFFNWHSHIAASVFYGFGLGYREIMYNSPDYSEEVLKDPEQTDFSDKRYNSANWKGVYGSLRLGFRIGFTVF